MTNLRLKTMSSTRTPEELTRLLLRVREGKDKEAFADIFDHFAPRLKSYLLRQGASPFEAEEFVQEALLSVWKHAERFDPKKASASTWIFTIARNKRIDALRKQKPVSADLEAAMDVESQDGSDVLNWAMTLESRQKQLQAALQSLPKEQKDLLMRSFFDSQSHGDIAAKTGLPLGTVKSRIRLALDRLRKSMVQEEKVA